ncbi:MAG: CBS domain-containing protein [Candidatus ainarchaeum sp.]|nr:CBS domain-containing protein [Candidatus ainarchaeum sp.]
MGSDLKVGDVMKKNVITVQESESIVRVSELMKKYDIGSVVVIKGKKADGIITERDIIHKIIAGKKNPEKTIAKEAMSAPIMVIKPNASLEEAAKAMKRHGIKRLPVINDEKELLGILTQGDIVSIFPAILDLVEEKARIQ